MSETTFTGDDFLAAIGGGAPLFRSLFENAVSAAVIALCDGQIVRTNRAFAALLGYAPGELEEFTLIGLLHTDDQERCNSILEETCCNPEHNIDLEARFVARDGHVMWGHLSANWAFDGNARPLCVVGLLTDITARKDAEQRVREEKELNQAILETALDAIITIDERGAIESFNGGAERMFGYSREEALGQNVSLLMSQPHRDQHDRYIAEYLRTGRPAVVGGAREFTARKRDGSLFPVQVSLAEFHFGEERRFCGFVRDLSEAKRTEHQLRQAQKMEAIGTLASGVAHDFNNLLMGVSGCASVAIDCLDRNSSARPYLAEIKKAAENGAAITQQLLTFGRKAELEPQLFGLDALIAQQAPMLRRLLGEDIAVALDLTAGDAQIHADVGQISQVVMNLVVNARDAMPRGGKLTIATEIAAIPASAGRERLLPRDAVPGRYVILSVIDDGCGMDRAICERIFDPFFTTKEPGKGTGLGLATVYGIIRQSHGYIQVQSEPNSGSRFDLLLPIAVAERNAEARPRAAAGNGAPSGTILVCEDDRLVRMAARYYLERAGYRTLEADTGDAALECCQQFEGPVDLFLTDIVLPGESGDRVAAEVQKLKPEARVLYMSAHSPEWLQRQGRVDRRIDALQKPFDEQYLLRAVDDALHRHPIPVTPSAPPVDEPQCEPPGAVPPSRGRVLVVASAAAARVAIAERLSGQRWEVICARGAAEGRDMLHELGDQVDVLLVDRALPDGEGEALAAEVRVVVPTVGVAYMDRHTDIRPTPPGPVLETPLDLEELSMAMDRLAPASAVSSSH